MAPGVDAGIGAPGTGQLHAVAKDAFERTT
jgi:hypothetical protein